MMNSMKHPLIAIVLCLLLFSTSFGLPWSPKLIGTPLPFADEYTQVIVQVHNSIRGSVIPPASNMQSLVRLSSSDIVPLTKAVFMYIQIWDDELADAASNFSAMCHYNLDLDWASSSFDSIGINIASIGTNILRLDTVYAILERIWTGSERYYNYTTNECSTSAGCNTYTQVHSSYSTKPQSSTLASWMVKISGHVYFRMYNT